MDNWTKNCVALIRSRLKHVGPVRAVGKLVGQWSKGRWFEPG
jgi:hypothetical protein